ncbi:Site-specific recombinase XerD [Terribacillus aidingensis]|uniref:Site-specific recombinase XerD n=1 Tax=Terribacillus aidingensis TaxID=586416 RepID=A0A285NKD6_9BACI|nr:tyrosine-type recombinase/integrase [Terribacillus aidingensis]SNZ09929.1 Site-specific recombinase XerD [Terribacillus aidingensis]
MADIKKNMLRERAKKIDEVTDEQWSRVNPFNRELVEEYLYESVHLSPKTLDQYKSGLRIFYSWVQEALGGKEVYKIKKKEFMRYQNYLVRRGMSSNGIKFKRSAVSSMNKYLLNFYEDDDNFLTFRNFIEGVPNPSPNKVYSKVPLTKVEIQNVKDALLEAEQYQILAAFSVLYDTGSRRSEFVQLKKEIISYEPLKDKVGNSVGAYRTHDVRTKGKGEQGLLRPLLLSDEAMGHIKLWLEHRGEDNCEFIFVSKQNNEYQPLHASAVNYWFKEIISDIIGRRVNPHIVRASRSSHLIKDSDGKLTKAQKLLGHKDSSTTNNFYNLNDDDDDVADMF